MATFFLVLIYITFVSLGLPDSLLGSAWPVLSRELGAPLSGAGVISFIITGGTIISSLLTDRLVRRLGTGKLTAVSVCMTAAALLGFSLAPGFWWLCLLAVPLGLGAGAVDALSLIHILSVSRIASPADRVRVGDDIVCAVKSRDEAGRLVLTMKELLGTWEENAARFAPGETVVGIVRSVEEYGVFVELAPNLAGLAEPVPGLKKGQMVSVYIKSILPQRMKIKLVILHALEDEQFRFPLQYTIQGGHIDHWVFSPPEAPRLIETVF